VRRFFTTAESGRSASALRWGERKGRWQRVGRGIYGEGSEVPSELDLALAAVIRAGGVASGRLAGVLHGLDSVHLRGPDLTVSPTASGRIPGARRRVLEPERIVLVDGMPCTDGLQTLVDLAATLDDLR